MRNREISARTGSRSYVFEAATATSAGSPPQPQADLRDRLGAVLASIETRVSPRWRLLGTALLGGLAAIGVGYLTSENPHAAAQGIAVATRVAIIAALIAAGVYAQTSRIQARMAALLAAAGFYSALWLLNGANNRFAFSVGLLCSGLAPTVFAYLMLIHPTGRLRSHTERRFLVIAGGGLMLLWIVAVLATAQPPLRTPLLECVPQCPSNAFFSRVTVTAVEPALKAGMVLCWFVLASGTAVLVSRRRRSASGSLQRSLTPIRAVALANPVLLMPSSWLGARMPRLLTHSALFTSSSRWSSRSRFSLALP